MSNPFSTSDAPNLVNKGRVYIKDGKRKMQTSDGVAYVEANTAKKKFGKMKGGKYSKLQDK